MTLESKLLSIDEDRCRRFEQAWRDGQPQSIEDCLPSNDHPLYLSTLEELVIIEMDFRARAGQMPRIEEYLRRFPLLNEVQAVHRLLDEEVRIRRRFADPVSPEEPFARFPGLSLSPTLVDSLRTVGVEGEPHIPGYELLGELGRGGMGIVYKARQKNLNRIVALKMIGGHGPIRAEIRERFQMEAEAIARLQHPNIVQVFEVGEMEGCPFLALEFVEGGNLAQQLAGQPQPVRDAARLACTLARAVAAAHEQGIVHRDLKPGNILLGGTREKGHGTGQENTVQGSSPVTLPSSLFPKITDFGLAKRLEAEPGQTRTGAILGTPCYMAPEQAAGRNREVGPAADVWALGVILYECLTGRPPFRGENELETLTQVVADEPVAPGSFRRDVQGDLETICLKCLQKDPGQRYPGAVELADDLERYLAGEPIRARPVQWRERLVKWVRRRPAQAALLGVSGVAALTTAGVIVALLLYGQLHASHQEVSQQKELAENSKKQAEQSRSEAEAAQKREEEARKREERALYLRLIQGAQLACRDDDRREALSLLDQCKEPFRGWEWHYVRRLCRPGLVTLEDHSRSVQNIAWLDGGRLTSVDLSGEVKVRSLAGGVTTHSFRIPAPSATAFDSGGKWLAVSWTNVEGTTIEVWDLIAGRQLGKRQFPPPRAGHVHSIAFSPDGRWLAWARTLTDASGRGRGGRVEAWEWQTERPTVALEGHVSAAWAVAFSPDGKALVSGGGTYDEKNYRYFSGELKLWEWPSGKAGAKLSGHVGTVHAVVFSPDGNQLASAGYVRFPFGPGEVKVWDVAGRREVFSFPWKKGAPRAVAFSPDGRLLAGAGDAGGYYDPEFIRVWNTQTGEEARVLRGHSGSVHCLRFSPGGERLASSSEIFDWDKQDQVRGEIKLWDVARDPEVVSLESAFRAAFTPDGRLLTVAWDGSMRLWDPSAGKLLAVLPYAGVAITSVACSSDGSRWAVGTHKGEVRIQDARTNRVLHSLAVATPLDSGKQVRGLDFSPDNQLLAVGAWSGEVTVWEVKTARLVRSLATLRGRSALAFDPSGMRLAAYSQLGELRVWNTGTWLETLSINPSEIMSVNDPALAWSPDGKRLATIGARRTAQVWEVATSRLLLTLRGHRFQSQSIAYSPDGLRIATGDYWHLKLWDSATGEELLTLRGHTAPVEQVCFRPRREAPGDYLVSVGADAVRVWDATPIRAVTPAQDR